MEVIIDSISDFEDPCLIAALSELNLMLDLELETLCLHLSSDTEILKINNQYLNHDFYTDIITFDLRDDLSKEAEIFISLDRVKENARLNSVDATKELYRVCTHGMLHLSGVSDKTLEEQQKMRTLENFYLEKLFL